MARRPSRAGARRSTRRASGGGGPAAVAHCPDGGVVTTPPSEPDDVREGACEIGPTSPDDRADGARRVRLEAAHCPHRDPRCDAADGDDEEICHHPGNGDEAYYYRSATLPDGATPNPFKEQYPASYTKGLPHDSGTGLGDPEVYGLLLRALATSDPDHFEAVRPLGCEEEAAGEEPPTLPPGQRRLENPQTGFAYALDAPDPAALRMPPAPCFASERAGGGRDRRGLLDGAVPGRPVRQVRHRPAHRPSRDRPGDPLPDPPEPALEQAGRPDRDHPRQRLPRPHRRRQERAVPVAVPAAIRPADSAWGNEDDACEPCVEPLDPDEYEMECDRDRRPGAPH